MYCFMLYACVYVSCYIMYSHAQVLDALLPIVLGMARTNRLPHAVHEMGEVAAAQLKELVRQLLDHVLAQDHGGEVGMAAAEQLQMLPVGVLGVGVLGVLVWWGVLGEGVVFWVYHFWDAQKGPGQEKDINTSCALYVFTMYNIQGDMVYINTTHNNTTPTKTRQRHHCTPTTIHPPPRTHHTPTTTHPPPHTHRHTHTGHHLCTGSGSHPRPYSCLSSPLCSHPHPPPTPPRTHPHPPPHHHHHPRPTLRRPATGPRRRSAGPVDKAGNCPSHQHADSECGGVTGADGGV